MVGSSGLPCDDGVDALQRALHEAVVDQLLDERAARAGADLALIEREHDEAFDRLVEEVVVLGADVIEEDVGRLAAELERHGNEVLRRILHDEPAGRRLAGEGDLGDAVRGGERLARFEAEAVDDVEHALRQEIADEFQQTP